MQTLIVFSHLRWNFVFQRPQQLMSRLAGRWHIVYIEEPVYDPGPARLASTRHGPDLVVLAPHTPVATGGFHDAQIALLAPLLAAYAERERLAGAVVWLTTPMALPLVDALQPACVVYDCIDDVGAGARADTPFALPAREEALLRRATLVFAGGPSLHAACKVRHPNVHLLPSAVDAAHFAPARLDAGSAEAASARRLQGALARPRLGFFGVIDERIDARLLDHLAASHPEWSLVLVGPVVKIDAARLPRRPNVHRLGMQPYALLPYLLDGWDLALVPYVVDDSTGFVSPAKVLEYMAGAKPVVSTPVIDVLAQYGRAVEIAPGPDGFVHACENVLAEPAERRARRLAEMRATVAAQSWDHAADIVHALCSAALAAAE